MDRRFEKLLNLTIKKKELESLLSNLGFERSPGKGSHVKWVKFGCPVIVLATHSKEIKPYQLKQVIKILHEAGLL